MTPGAWYEPRAGGVAWRVINYLETLAPGTEVSTAMLAEAIDTPPDNVAPCLEPALKHGALYRRQKFTHPRSPFFWSLTDHTAAAAATALAAMAPALQGADAAISDCCRAAVPCMPEAAKAVMADEVVPPPPRLLHKVPLVGSCDIDELHHKIAAAAGEAPPGDFICALYSNGTLLVESRGQRLTLPAEHTRQLLHYLDHRWGAEVVTRGAA